MLVAGLRAIVQLGIAALVIAAVVTQPGVVGAARLVMFAMGVLTTTRRVEAPRSWPAAAAAMAAGILPCSRSCWRPARSP